MKTVPHCKKISQKKNPPNEGKTDNVGKDNGSKECSHKALDRLLWTQFDQLRTPEQHA
jgi:hypothetical protein